MGSESKSADMRHNSNDGRSEYSKVQRNRNIRNGLIFIAPNFIGFFILILIPVLTLFYTSFTKWSALGEPEFNGLKNWRRMLPMRASSPPPATHCYMPPCTFP